jgi:hypothetical protein
VAYRLHIFNAGEEVLINDTKPLGIDPQLESDLLERELENGVIVEQEAFVHEDSLVRLLGGLITAEEHVVAREANPRVRRV